MSEVSSFYKLFACAYTRISCKFNDGETSGAQKHASKYFLQNKLLL